MLLTLQNLPTGKKLGKSGNEAGWNLAKKDGQEKYKQLTEAKSEKIKEIIENEAFGKTSRKVKVPKKDVPKKDSENAEKARELIDKQSKMIEEEVEKIKTSTK